MSAIIAYNVSSQQAVTATFTELQQQLLAQVTASTGLTWFMENQKEMYVFAKRASNRKFKQEIDTKWLITQTLSALKEKTDELQQQSEGGQADQSSMDSGKKGEQVAEAKEVMEVDGTGPSGMPKAPAPKEKVPTPPKRHNVEDHEGLRIKRLDEAMRRRMEKGKGKATDMAALGVGKAMEEIMVRKIVVPKKCATVKSKLMVSSETDEAGKAAPPVASPSKDVATAQKWKSHVSACLISQMRRQREEVPPVPAEWQVFVQETNRWMDDMAQQIGDLGREVNRRLESNFNKLESIDRGLKLVLDMLGQNGLADTEGSVEQRSELVYQAGGSADNRTLVGKWAQCHSNTPIAPIVTEPAQPAPMPPSSLPPPLPDMPPPPPAVSPPYTPLPAPHHTLSPSQAPASPSTPPPHSPSLMHSLSLAQDLPTTPSPPAPSQVDVNMDLALSLAAAALIVTVQELTPHANTAFANLSHALAQLQVPRMTRVQSATPTEILRRSTRLMSQTPAPDDSKAAKRKATGSALTKTKRLKK
ncbi:hypothetical protein BDN71DRAFT_1429091 [Pleurotus eryngii]|uniref:Uncharacterized protein n=1 Tax=Pleurotus eryngii TaxID=5323 RepID=A0A9P6DAV6_PLEER|nr:hypothetical protein BDN71DRAFT_1429091 [Pleurotus eryngii]